MKVMIMASADGNGKGSVNNYCCKIPIPDRAAGPCGAYRQSRDVPRYPATGSENKIRSTL